MTTTRRQGGHAFKGFDKFQYSARPDLLKDREILVTGAGRGLGAAAPQTEAPPPPTPRLRGSTL
ncbi:hypothetical protein ACPTHP_35550, partial [Pseudomonas aeruginosa]